MSAGVVPAEIVHQRGKAHRQRRVHGGGGVDDHHGVHAGVDLGVIVGALRHAPQPVELGQQADQRTAVAQHGEQARRPRLQQPARQFLPDPLGHQRVHLAGLGHALHQRAGLGGDVELGEARGKARHAQDAHRVFDEGLGDVAEGARGEIRLPAVRVDDGADQRAVLRHALRHRVDGQVTADQVVFERDVGGVVDREALVAGRRLALGARQRVLGLRARVQEDREILAHGAEAARLHRLGRGADDDVVAVLHGQAQQCVANGAAHGIHVEPVRGRIDDGVTGRCCVLRHWLAATSVSSSSAVR